MTIQISIRSSKNLVEQFNKLAKETDRSRAYLVNQAMEQYIAREAWQVAEIKKSYSRSRCRRLCNK